MSTHVFKELNILGTQLQVCSLFPSTGYKRTGTCTIRSLEISDFSASVCCVTTPEFLQWGMRNNFDLLTRKPGQWGLNPEGGERWCISVDVWLRSYKSNCAPYIVPEATNIRLLNYLSLDELKPYII